MRALWFSGGKDSMACLYLYRDELKGIHVIWANTGKNYPEALELIGKAKEMCPNWHEVKTDRDSQWQRLGYPSDVVPVDWTALGQVFSSTKNVKVQSYLQCCYENIIFPVIQKTRELGCGVVIRGQRNSEPHKAPNTESEFTFIHPIEAWSDVEVLSYLKGKMELPKHYELEHSSMDCFDCTAFASHSEDRARYTKERHPELYKVYISGMRELTEAIRAPLGAYERICNG